MPAVEEVSLVSLANTREGSSAVMVALSMTCKGESGEVVILMPKIINKLAWVKFRGSTKVIEGKIKFSISFSSVKHILAKDDCVKINVRSKLFKYSALSIDVPNNDWSKWQEMRPYNMLETGKVHPTTVSIVVTAYKCKKETVLSKLYTDSDFTDFRLATSEGSVPVHKAYLAAHSDVFKAMLSNEWKETTTGEITMKGVTIETLQHLKEYMYLGTVPNDGLRPLLLIARCYLIEDLEQHCIRKLAENVTGKSLFSLLEFACDNNIPELSFALVVMTENIDVNHANKLKNKKAVLDSQKSKKSQQ
ncbi:uncharacterized protein LOC134749374 [Cydia strobilella]|uniref:uncharacterized protein LOC134749374 n=1 Tax=Cydia strobilella TaxID=1100964 RepID=UPI00300599C0